MGSIPSTLAAKIDDKVAAGKVIPEWRKFFRLHSVQWNVTGFFVAVGYSAALAAGVLPFRSLHHGRLYDAGVIAVLACVFLASMRYRLKPQPGVSTAAMTADEMDHRSL